MSPKGLAVTSKLPFNTNYRSRRVQSIYTASDISAVSVNGRRIGAIQLKVTALPTQPLVDFQVEYGLTKKSSLEEGWLPTTMCYGPQTTQLQQLPRKDNWVMLPLKKQIVWDRESNLVLQFSFQGNALETDRGTIAAVKTDQASRTRSYGTDEPLPDPFPNLLWDRTSSTVPCLRLQFEDECPQVCFMHHADLGRCAIKFLLV